MTEMYPYATINDVKLHVGDKVGKDKLTNVKIRYFLSSACVRVHQDFSRAYVIPFQNIDGNEYTMLPQDTLIAIRDMVVYYCSYLILKNYFGNNESYNNSIEYADNELSLYNEAKSLYMGVNRDNVSKSTPLAGLKLNPNASFRSVAGLPSGKTGNMGSNSNSKGILVLDKLSNLHKSMWNGRTYKIK